MALQKTFKETYSNRLQYEAKKGIGIERYTMPEFGYDKSQVLIIPTLMRVNFYVQWTDLTQSMILSKDYYQC